MGIALNKGKSGNYLMDLANSLVGWFYGGLSSVMVVVNMFFGGCSGSAVADASSIGGVMIPEMVRRGYGKGYAAALNAYKNLASAACRATRPRARSTPRPPR
mgnify:CR=1 FL=1